MCVVVVVVGHRAAVAVSSKAHATVHVCPAPLLPPPHRAACFVLQAATPESNGGRARARAREREGEGEGDRVRARVRGRERERQREGKAETEKEQDKATERERGRHRERVWVRWE